MPSLAEPEVEEQAKQSKRRPLIEVVSHCYAAELPQYAAFLVYQASSLVLHKPRSCDVCLSVCVWSEKENPDDLTELLAAAAPPMPWRVADPNVAKVLPWVKQTLIEHGVGWSVCHLTRGEIGRRCIGRNRLALASEADIVWFADVDQVFRDGVLDRLATMEWPEGASMIHPREIMIHRDHKTGDTLVRDVPVESLFVYGPFDVNPAEFVPKRYNRAIGGVQIIRGDFARKHGYLNGDEKWRAVLRPFGDFRDDVAYRRFCSERGAIVAVNLPGVFRLRHARTTYQEDKK